MPVQAIARLGLLAALCACRAPGPGTAQDGEGREAPPPAVGLRAPAGWVAHPVWDFTVQAPAGVDVFPAARTDYTVYGLSVRGPPRRTLGVAYAGYHPNFPRAGADPAPERRVRLADADARVRERTGPDGRRWGEVLVDLPVARFGAPPPPGAQAYTVDDARYLHFWYDSLPAADAALYDSIIRTLRRAPEPPANAAPRP